MLCIGNFLSYHIETIMSITPKSDDLLDFNSVFKSNSDKLLEFGAIDFIIMMHYQ